MTVVAGRCRGRLVGASVTPVGDPVAVANFSGAARAAGLTVLARRAPPASLTNAEPPPKRKKKESRKAFADAQAGVADARAASAARRWSGFVAAEDARLARGTSIGFTGYQDAAHDGEIAVATNTPYVLGTVRAPVRIAAYGDTPGAMSALVDVLLGKAKAPGSLPVPVARRRARRLLEGLDQQGGAGAGDAGHHQGGGVVAAQVEALAQVLRHDLDAALLDRQRPDAALAQRRLERLLAVGHLLEHPVGAGERGAERRVAVT